MAEKKDVKGITSKKNKLQVKFMPTRMENKKLSKAEFIEWRKKNKEANAAADAARAKVLSDQGVTPEEADSGDKKSALNEKVASLKEQILESKKEFSKDPKSKRLGNKLAKLASALDNAENELDALEDN